MVTKERIIKGVIWKSFERFGTQIISLVISIILARLLLPEDYGLVALTTIFITVASVFVTYGLGTALIQKKNADILDFSTIFYFNIFVSIFMYLILFFIAPDRKSVV